MRTRHRRLAFTLIELIVVITIILVLTAIGVMAIPSAQDRNMQTGADQLQGWLLIAKQRAKRDGVPTGLRIMIDPATNVAGRLQYIQQPDDFAIQGTFCTGVSSATVTFTDVMPPPSQPYLIDAMQFANITPGDYLEVYRGGGVYMITSSPAPTTMIHPITMRPVNAWQVAIASPNPNLNVNNIMVQEYRIRRQPMPIAGEDELVLPEGIVLDANAWLDAANTPHQKCVTSPPLPTTPPLPPFCDIVFSPQGGLVGHGTGSDRIVMLWISNVANAAIPPLLMSIQAHTGFIGIQPIGGGAPPYTTFVSDPYKFCRDGRSSGL